MKKIFIKTLIAFLSAAVFNSCIEEVQPYGSTVTKDQLEEQADMILSTMINGIPASMTAAELVGTGYQTDFGLPAIHIMTESMLEDFICKGEPYYDQFVYFVASLDMGPTSSEGTYYWYAYYKWIKMANDIISMVDPGHKIPRNYTISARHTPTGRCVTWISHACMNLSRTNTSPFRTTFQDLPYR